MKNRLMVVALGCLLALLWGCSEVKDALDIEFDIEYHRIFSVRGEVASDSYHFNLEDDEDYERYKDRIRGVRIGYVRYAITSNTGTEGRVDFYAGDDGTAFANARKVAQTVVFAAGETRLTTDVDWINLPYWEGLLGSGRFSLWVVGSGSGVDVIMPVEIQIEVTVNPLE